MTSAKLLQLLRRRLSDVDGTAPLYGDPVLWDYVDDALLNYVARKVAGFAGYTVDTGVTPGITPEPSDSDGLRLALGAAALLLRDLYADKVSRGELGMSWTSGFESESTIDTRRAYDGAIRHIESEIEELTLIAASTSSGTRVQ